MSDQTPRVEWTLTFIQWLAASVAIDEKISIEVHGLDQRREDIIWINIAESTGEATLVVWPSWACVPYDPDQAAVDTLVLINDVVVSSSAAIYNDVAQLRSLIIGAIVNLRAVPPGEHDCVPRSG